MQKLTLFAAASGAFAPAPQAPDQRLCPLSQLGHGSKLAMTASYIMTVPVTRH